MTTTIKEPRSRAKYLKPDDFEKTVERFEPHFSPQQTARIVNILFSDRGLGDRVHACEICEKVFWRLRAGSTCCSRTCSNCWHQRRHYQKKMGNPVV